jgi:hypothetical protein
MLTTVRAIYVKIRVLALMALIRTDAGVLRTSQEIIAKLTLTNAQQGKILEKLPKRK